MAEDDIVARFVSDSRRLISDLKEQVRLYKEANEAQKEVDRTSQKASRSEESNAQKRKRLLREEIQDLVELSKMRDDAFSPEEIEEYNKRINETNKRIRNLNGQYGKLEKQAGALDAVFKRLGTTLIATFSIDRIIRFSREAIELAGKMEGVQRAFNNLNNPRLLSNLRTATRGTISDLELMQKAVQAKNLQVPVEQLAKFFEFATLRASQTGESVDYLVDSIVTGIGRKSIRVIDNLGISATQVREEMGGIGIESASTAQLAEALGRIIQKEMTEAGEVTITTAQRTASLEAEYENLKVQIGQQLTPAYNDFLDVLISVGNAMIKQGGEVKRFSTGVDLLESGLENTDRVVALLEQSLGRQLTVGERARILFKGFTDDQYELAEAQRQLNEESKEWEALMNRINAGPFKDAEDRAKAYAESLSEVQKRLGYVASTNEEVALSINYYKEQIKSLQEQQGNSTTTEEYLRYQRQIEDIQRKINVLTGEYARLLREYNFEQGKAAKHTKEVTDEINKQIEADIASYFEKSEAALKKYNLTLQEWAEIWSDQEAERDFENLEPLDLDKYKEDLEEKQRIEEEDAARMKELYSEVYNSIFQIASNNIAREAQERQNAINSEEEKELASLQKRYDAGLISEEQYRAKQAEIQERYDEERKRIQREQAEKEKALAIFQATIQGAVAVIKAGIITPLALAAAIAAAAQIAAIASTPIPQFFEGTDYLMPWASGQGRRKDDIPVMAHMGEAIINSNRNKEAPGLAKAWNSGNLEKWIFKQYDVPAIRDKVAESEREEKNSFARNIADSLIFNSNNGDLIRAINRSSRKEREDFERLIGVIRSRNRQNRRL